ncbi:hypothetical protein DRH14_02775, partial [Candidatus Shapirobacteria bacterium]
VKKYKKEKMGVDDENGFGVGGTQSLKEDGVKLVFSNEAGPGVRMQYLDACWPYKLEGVEDRWQEESVDVVVDTVLRSVVETCKTLEGDGHLGLLGWMVLVDIDDGGDIDRNRYLDEVIAPFVRKMFTGDALEKRHDGKVNIHPLVATVLMALSQNVVSHYLTVTSQGFIKSVLDEGVEGGYVVE